MRPAAVATSVASPEAARRSGPGRSTTTSGNSPRRRSVPPPRSPVTRAPVAPAERTNRRNAGGRGPESTDATSIRTRSISAAERNGSSVAAGPSDSGSGASRSRRSPSIVRYRRWTRPRSASPTTSSASTVSAVRNGRWWGSAAPTPRRRIRPLSGSKDTSRAGKKRPDASSALRTAASRIRNWTAGTWRRTRSVAGTATRRAAIAATTRRARDLGCFAPRATLRF